MTDYRELSEFEKAKVDKLIFENIQPKKHTNECNGFTWVEPQWTLSNVHRGDYCADCWMIYYNCLCSHY